VTDDPFKYIPPAPEKIPAFDAVALAIVGVYKALNDWLPDSREKSLAITKLQECRMWANAGISFHEVKGMSSAVEEK
jgi:hypothetical protein